MKIKLKNIYDSHSIIENETGNSILIDDKTSQNPKGVSPMELLLMGVAGCSSIDIISILKKQKQKFEKLTIEVEGIREKGELPALFQKIHSKIKFDGKIDEKKLFELVNFLLQNIVLFQKHLKQQLISLFQFT